MLNSLISNIQPKTMKIAFDYVDWLKELQDEMNEFQRFKFKD